MSLIDEIKAEEGKSTSLLDEIRDVEPSFYQKWIKPIAEPIVEAAGLISGGMVGLAAGGPLGAVAGGGLGYAGAKQVYRVGEEIAGAREPEPVGKQMVRTFAPVYQTPEGEWKIGEVAKGAGYEAAGQVTGAVVKGGYNVGKKAVRKVGAKLGFPRVTKKGIEEETIERFQKLKTSAESSTQVKENIEVAKSLEKEIPGLKFSYGQLTNDADAIALERALARTGGATLSQQQRAIANKSLEDYYATKVSGVGKAEDFVGAIAKEKTGKETIVKTAQEAVDTEVEMLSRHLDEQTIGKRIHTVLSKGQKATRDKATTLYNKIPDVKIQTDTLNKTLDNVLKDYDSVVENSQNIPIQLINRLKKAFTVKGKTVASPILDESGKPIMTTIAEQSKPIGFQQLRKLRSNIIAEIRTAQGSATPNDQYIRRLRMIQEGIEDTIDTLSGDAGQAGQLYREASSFYKEYAGRFKQGTVADILAKGRRGEETKIGLANIASKFDHLDGIDDFARAVGDKNIAKDAMRDYYQFDFLNKTRNAEGEIVTKKAMQWIYKNTGKLKKLGLFEEFKITTLKRYGLEVAEKNLDVFNKSVANKILGADIDDFVRTAFRGSKNYATTAQELLGKVKGNKAAENGLKKAFADNLMKEAENTSPEFFQAMRAETPSEIEFVKSVAKLTNNLKKYSSAIKVIYKDEPQKIKAIHDVWGAYQILARTSKSPLGGGSDTIENMFNILVGAGGARAGRFYLIKSIRDAFSKFSERKINDYMRRIMFDPEFAANFTSFKNGVTPERISNFRRLMAVTYSTTGRSIENMEENKEQ